MGSIIKENIFDFTKKNDFPALVSIVSRITIHLGRRLDLCSNPHDKESIGHNGLACKFGRFLLVA